MQHFNSPNGTSGFWQRQFQFIVIFIHPHLSSLLAFSFCVLSSTVHALTATALDIWSSAMPCTKCHKRITKLSEFGFAFLHITGAVALGCSEQTKQHSFNLNKHFLHLMSAHLSNQVLVPCILIIHFLRSPTAIAPDKKCLSNGFS